KACVDKGVQVAEGCCLRQLQGARDLCERNLVSSLGDVGEDEQRLMYGRDNIPTIPSLGHAFPLCARPDSFRHMKREFLYALSALCCRGRQERAPARSWA